MKTSAIFLSKFGVFWTGTFLLVPVLNFHTKGYFDHNDLIFVFIALCLWPSRIFIYGGPKLKVLAMSLACGLASLALHIF